MIRLVVAALLLAAAQEGPSADLQRLVEALDSDSIDVRDRASAELRASGDAVVPALRLERAAARSAEVLARIDGVLRRIDADRKRQAFRGGAASHGWGARLGAAWDPAERALTLTLDVMNVSERPQEFAAIRWFDYTFPQTCYTSGGGGRAHLFVRPTSKYVEPNMYLCTRRLGAVRPEGVEILDSGESRSFLLRLGEAERKDAQLPPGEYEAFALYETKPGSRMAATPDDVTSNTITFTIPQ